MAGPGSCRIAWWYCWTWRSLWKVDGAYGSVCDSTEESRTYRPSLPTRQSGDISDGRSIPEAPLRWWATGRRTGPAVNYYLFFLFSLSKRTIVRVSRRLFTREKRRLCECPPFISWRKSASRRRKSTVTLLAPGNLFFNRINIISNFK